MVLPVAVVTEVAVIVTVGIRLPLVPRLAAANSNNASPAASQIHRFPLASKARPRGSRKLVDEIMISGLTTPE